MRVVCISDTHGRHDEIDVPEGDVLVHAGDFTMAGTIKEVVAFNRWLHGLPHGRKIVVAGNHDFMFEQNPHVARQLIGSALYLEDSGAVLDGVHFYGSPWQPWFMNWAFNLQRGEDLRRKWDLIPEGVDVLITHGPPRMFLDEVTPGEHVGCAALQARVYDLRPRLHVFGHIHEGYGVEESDGVTFVNASVCDEHYRPVNAPIVFDLSPRGSERAAG